ncbi:hypothetical protein ACEQ8H_004711 [Pleosporales sp. CAS-2024a]
MGLTRVDSLLSDTRTHKPLSLTDLCEDVILLICSHLDCMRADKETPLKSLCLTNRHLHSILVPCLFKTIHTNRPISQLAPTTLAAQYAHTFRLDMFGSLWWWCSGAYTSSSDALDLFHCIQGLPRVRALEVSMMRRSIDMFSAAFSTPSEQDFNLSGIQSLVATSSAAFLVNHCPNLRRLEIRDESACLLETYTDLSARLAPLRNAPTSPHPPLLTHFDATATWSADEVSFVVQTFPRLESLRMRSDTYTYRASTPIIMAILSAHLARIKTLHLVKSGSLGMGYQSIWTRLIHASSNDEYRQTLWRDNERLRVTVENNIVRDAFRQMPSLRTCWLGEKRVARKCAADHDGWWMWERERRSKDMDNDSCIMGKGRIASLRMEKEAVVVRSEMAC